jgi:integrase
MAEHNAENERIKHQYFAYLKEAKRQSEATVDGAAKALNRFEVYTKYRNFKLFHIDQATAFKRYLAEQRGAASGTKLSKATLYTTLTQLKRFFQWLSDKPGYKSRLQYSDADYFNLSGKDTRIATAQREQRAPTLEQIKHVIRAMPTGTEIDRRNQALIAFTILTGARDSAIASMSLKHVDMVTCCVNQDAREVQTKFSKTFKTFFFPVGDDIRRIVDDWVLYLRIDKLWGNDGPLFPATHIALGPTRQFGVSGLERVHWKTTSPIRNIFREAFELVGFPYFNPHSFRNTLVRLGQEICRTPEEFKAWSQNLGHEKPLTTFVNYGEVASQRQGEIMQDLAIPVQPARSDFSEIAKAVIRELRVSGLEMSCGNEPPNGSLRRTGRIAGEREDHVRHETLE